MKFWRTITAVTSLALVGGAIYGWGIGWFYACGPFDKVLKLSKCNVVATFDANQIEGLLGLEDGKLLAVLRGDGQAPSQKQRIVAIDPAEGSIGAATELQDVPNAASWMSAALSPDETRLAGSLFDGRPVIIDRTTGRTLLTIEPYYNVAMIDFLDNERVMVDRGNVSSGRPPARAAMVFSAIDGGQQADIAGEPTLPLYRQGLANAVSPDGKILVQHEQTSADSGIVAMRIADSAFPDWASPLAVAPLGAWRLGDHLWPDVWFSPDGQFVAASFDGARSWGEETSAIMIWEVSTRRLQQRIPSYQAGWRYLVWLEDRQVAAARFNLDTRRTEIAVIDY